MNTKHEGGDKINVTTILSSIRIIFATFMSRNVPLLISIYGFLFVIIIKTRFTIQFKEYR